MSGKLCPSGQGIKRLGTELAHAAQQKLPKGTPNASPQMHSKNPGADTHIEEVGAGRLRDALSAHAGKVREHL